MTTHLPLRRRADGSLDTGFYTGKGRSARSRQAHRLLARIASFFALPRRDFAGRRRPVALRGPARVH